MKAKVLIGLFIILLLVTASAALGETRIALGKTFNTSSVTYGEIGYEWRGWELAAALLGEGDYGKKGNADAHEVFSLSRIIRPGWGGFYQRLGVAHVSNPKLVGETNYRLGLGYEWPAFRIEYFHYSSAGINPVNSGVDGVILTVKLPGGHNGR